MPTEAKVRLWIDGQLAQAGWSEKQGNLSKEWPLKGDSLLKYIPLENMTCEE